jgi:hypothetical protein
MLIEHLGGGGLPQKEGFSGLNGKPIPTVNPSVMTAVTNGRKVPAFHINSSLVARLNTLFCESCQLIDFSPTGKNIL